MAAMDDQIEKEAQEWAKNMTKGVGENSEVNENEASQETFSFNIEENSSSTMEHTMSFE